MWITFIDKKDKLWNKLIDYANSCDREAGPILAQKDPRADPKAQAIKKTCPDTSNLNQNFLLDLGEIRLVP